MSRLLCVALLVLSAQAVRADVFGQDFPGVLLADAAVPGVGVETPPDLLGRQSGPPVTAREALLRVAEIERALAAVEDLFGKIYLSATSAGREHWWETRALLVLGYPDEAGYEAAVGLTHELQRELAVADGGLREQAGVLAAHQDFRLTRNPAAYRLLGHHVRLTTHRNHLADLAVAFSLDHDPWDPREPERDAVILDLEVGYFPFPKNLAPHRRFVRPLSAPESGGGGAVVQDAVMVWVREALEESAVRLDDAEEGTKTLREACMIVWPGFENRPIQYQFPETPVFVAGRRVAYGVTTTLIRAKASLNEARVFLSIEGLLGAGRRPDVEWAALDHDFDRKAWDAQRTDVVSATRRFPLFPTRSRHYFGGRRGEDAVGVEDFPRAWRL